MGTTLTVKLGPRTVGSLIPGFPMTIVNILITSHETRQRKYNLLSAAVTEQILSTQVVIVLVTSRYK